VRTQSGLLATLADDSPEALSGLPPAFPSTWAVTEGFIIEHSRGSDCAIQSMFDSTAGDRDQLAAYARLLDPDPIPYTTGARLLLPIDFAGIDALSVTSLDKFLTGQGAERTEQTTSDVEQTKVVYTHDEEETSVVLTLRSGISGPRLESVSATSGGTEVYRTTIEYVPVSASARTLELPSRIVLVLGNSGPDGQSSSMRRELTIENYDAKESAAPSESPLNGFSERISPRYCVIRERSVKDPGETCALYGGNIITHAEWLNLGSPTLDMSEVE